VKNTPSAALRKRRDKLLLHGLPPLARLLRGSLLEKYKRCGRPGCHCANNRGHGPKRYLSISTTGQRPQIDYVPNDAFSKVTEYLDNYRNVREALNEICAINTELLRRREDLD
jgi:hypothetical protein